MIQQNMNNIHINKHRIDTFSAKEWLEVLKARWNISSTMFRESEDRIVITHTPQGNSTVLVGEYNKITKRGYVLDRRKESR